MILFKAAISVFSRSTYEKPIWDSVLESDLGPPPDFLHGTIYKPSMKNSYEGVVSFVKGYNLSKGFVLVKIL